MARFCNRCGRPLDAEHHDIGESKFVFARRGRGRMKLQKVRIYGCRVRLTAVSPATGRTIVPNTTDRIKETDTAYRHESRFKDK